MAAACLVTLGATIAFSFLFLLWTHSAVATSSLKLLGRSTVPVAWLVMDMSHSAADWRDEGVPIDFTLGDLRAVEYSATIEAGESGSEA